jgi:hypothetical protein
MTEAVAPAQLSLWWLEAVLGALALGVAVAFRPWRMLSLTLLTPALAALALLPWMWLLPQKLPQGLEVQFSGASLLVLMLGWPLAVPVLSAVALLVWALGRPVPWPCCRNGSGWGWCRPRWRC